MCDSHANLPRISLIEVGILFGLWIDFCLKVNGIVLPPPNFHGLSSY